LFVTIEPDSEAIPTRHRVTFSEKDERFADVEAEESVEDIVLQSLMPEPPFVPSGDELDDDTLLAAAQQLETNKRKWEVSPPSPLVTIVRRSYGSRHPPAYVSILRKAQSKNPLDSPTQIPAVKKTSLVLIWPSTHSEA